LDIRKRYDEQQEKTVLSVNIDTRKAEKIDREDWSLGIENERRSAKGLELFTSYDDLKEFNENKEKVDDDIDIDIDTDYLLNEGAFILSDYIYLNTNLLISEAA
jgi:carboxyl-terminal processing protease